MDSNRSKTKEPFPGNGSIPLRLRQLFSEAGIQPNASLRIPWEDLPYALYDKGLYLSGLPASLFFAKDNPSSDEQLARLNLLLKWPFQGVQNPLRLLQQACASGSLMMLPRPPGRDVVFEVVKDDGSKMDIGKWKAPRPLAPRPKPTATSSLTPVDKSSTSTPVDSPIVGTATSAAHISGSSIRPMSPASPSTPAPKSNAMNKAGNMRTKPAAPQKTSVPRVTHAPSKVSKARPQPEPFPESKNLPLKLCEILKEAGALESKNVPGRIRLNALPEVLWSSGRYITGIRASVIVGDMDPTIKQIKEVGKRPLRFNLPKDEVAKMENALKRGEIKLLPRPKGRDVVFEVITDEGPMDIRRWVGTATEPPTPSRPNEARSLQTPQNAASRRKQIIDDSSDEAPVTTLPANAGKSATVSSIQPTNPFPRSKEVSLGFRRLFGERQRRHICQSEVVIEKAGVVEDPRNPGFIPWSDIPHALWRGRLYITGLPRDLVLGTNSVENITRQPWTPFRWQDHETPQLREALQKGKVSLRRRPTDRNVVFEMPNGAGGSLDIGQWHEASSPSPPTSELPSENDMQTSIHSEEENGMSEDMPPLRMWHDEVNNVMDQLADMLVHAGVKLPPHPTREGAYKIIWPDLPGLLHDAQVTLAGFPLSLLPYWKPQGRINGKWVVGWNRAKLDHMVDLLDNEGVGVEKWNPESKTIVQAVDGDTDDEYSFTYDDFVNAKIDDPEQLAVDGRIVALVEPNTLGKRKRPMSNLEQDERASKRQKTRLEAALDSPSTDIRELETDSDDGMAEHITRAVVEDNLPTSREGTASVASGGYFKPPHDTNLSIAELNAKYRKQKEVIKSIIAILIYHDIPCIAPEDEGLAFFLPWSNLPRHLAARKVYLAGWPSLCAPTVDDDTVVVEFGPHSWADEQWNALEKALENDAIDVKKPHGVRQLFELVDPNDQSTKSNVNFGREWIHNNWGIEVDQAVSIFAKDVSIMDPIVEETDDEESDEDEMALDL